MCLCSAAQTDTVAARSSPQNAFDTSVSSPLLLIADIAISGNKKTKPYIIEREIPFKQGDYILKKDLEAKLILAKEQIINTSLFVYVDVYVVSQAGELVFIKVDVKERWYLFPLPYFKLVDRNFNQWWVKENHSLKRVNYGLKFMQNNVTGRNDMLNIFLISGYNHEVDLRYIQPFADRALKSGFDVGFLYQQQHEMNYGTSLSKQVFYKENDNYTRKTIRAEAAYLYRPAVKTRHTFRVAYVHEEIADSAEKLNPNYFNYGAKKMSFPEVSYTMQYFGVDNIAYPLNGFTADFSLLQRGFNKKMEMTQLEAHASFSHPFIGNTNLQLQAAGIIRAPFDQPYYNQQLFGYGDVFLRGLEYYVVDGVAGVLGRATERKQLFTVVLKPKYKTKEYAPIPFRFYLKAFGDIGYGYSTNSGNSLLNNKLMHTWGFGMDIVSLYDAVFKFEYSFNQFGESGLFFHVQADF
ncbi:MAG TPA: POTRA domain-containing protein [Chitinophagaceae bacterium]|nr:POTRA domain-containing protein [Chitinophagaceae bacterium]